ncbi:ammonium transporter [Oscillatoriales cyanobacterium LEGE 11467]|uniref:histidine kinase n=1 Tax=Zarconia navalis LEGE 11467 TaxID=1828826 RepID=A0A928Z857_9CYAN|nr:ammonium transporter [Zarconia navalis]MBE9041245.1 ammonium transporter [Zarconia navalis LEGE 11467]
MIWILVCSALVFLMQPGFMCLESGLTRSKNSINVAIKNLADFGISVICFWLFGYAFMFGASRAGWLGTTGFSLNFEAPAPTAFFLFQAMFCSTATTIVSGAVAERMKFEAYAIVVILTSGLIYPVFGHWVWNGNDVNTSLGWLSKLGFVDFAGSTVVHGIGAWIALAVLLVIGPRTGRFSPSGSRRIHGSNIQLSVLGTLLLWMGWLGFNGGSTLTFDDRVPAILVHTILAGATGMTIAGAIGWLQHRILEVELLINGSLAGLVAITACCDVVSTPISAMVGVGGGAVMVLVSYWLERWQIDDAVGAIAVHGGAGIWGTLAVALFGRSPLPSTELSRYAQLGVQLLGIAVGFVWAFGITYLVLRTVAHFFPLRVSPQQERIGLNISEHGARTDLYDLLAAMETQRKTQDLSLRVPVEPFTQVGVIADRYNQAIEALEDAVTRTGAIVNTAINGMITFAKPNLEILTLNPSAEEMFGYSQEALAGKFMYQLLQEDGEVGAIDLDRWLGERCREFIGLRGDGSKFYLKATIVEVHVARKSFYTGTFEDISQHKHAETARQKSALALAAKNQELQQALQELQQAQLQLIQTEKMSSLGQMVAGIAHEINNPVSFIHGNLTYASEYTNDLLRLLQVYQQEYPDPTDKIAAERDEIDIDFLRQDLDQLLQSMKVGTDRICEIVRSLRTFSRLDEAQVKDIDLHESLDSTLTLLRHRLKATPHRSQIEIVREYGSLPRVDCYPGPLNQVFMNLLANAIDALEETTGKRNDLEPKIWIRTEVTNKNWVQIAIADNGSGIPEKVRTKLFDPFFTTKPIGKGTGLGLSISYQIIVDRHRGKLQCESVPGEATTFTIEIPIHQY